MKFAVLNDTSSYHCGSAAVMSVIYDEIKSVGGEVVYKLDCKDCKDCYGRGVVDSRPMRDADVILINGEGNMHHGDGLNILLAAFEYVGSGKKIMLVNSVWDKMPKEACSIIRQFDRVFAREIISYRNMIDAGVARQRLGLFPDLCMQADDSVVSGHTHYTDQIIGTNSYMPWGEFCS